MPFGTVPVWDGALLNMSTPTTTPSPMPFGTVPVWDRRPSDMFSRTASVVSNAFRHGPGLGPHAVNHLYETVAVLSPMPFGTVPVWDQVAGGDDRSRKLRVSNAFRHGPGLGLAHLYEAIAVFDPKVSNAFRHGPGLGLSSVRRSTVRRTMRSPMPFGTVPVWDLRATFQVR